MRCFPVFTDVEGAAVIVAGEGRLLHQRIGKLLPYGCRLLLFTRSEVPEAAENRQIEVFRRTLQAEDLEPRPAFVAAAGLDMEENRRISALCRERGIPVNVADVPALCSFCVPAILRRGALTVAIGTDGTYPAAAALIRERLEKQIPEGMDAILEWAQDLRRQLRAEIPAPERRSALLRHIMEEAMEKNRPLTDGELRSILAE